MACSIASLSACFGEGQVGERTYRALVNDLIEASVHVSRRAAGRVMLSLGPVSPQPLVVCL